MKSLELLIDLEDVEIVVSAPALGRFYPSVSPGQALSAGQSIGELMVLGERIALVLPKDIANALVIELLPKQRGAAISYRTPLVRLSQLESGSLLKRPLVQQEEAELTAGQCAIRAFSEGQFYRASSPNSPPFAKDGELLQPGQTLGLIEVMKSYYDLKFEPPKANLQYKLARFTVNDGQAIEQGATIALIEQVG